MDLQPLTRPYDDLTALLQKTAHRFHESPEKVPVQQCLEEADADANFVTFRRESYDARTGPFHTRPQLVSYQKPGSGSGMKILRKTFAESGKQMDKKTAEILVKIVDKADTYFKLIERAETLAYADVLETLLNRLNFWLQKDDNLWRRLTESNITFGPFSDGKSGCSYSALCLYWCGGIDKNSEDCKEQEKILDLVMEAAEDKYLAELLKENVVIPITANTFRREVYSYVTKVKGDMDRNLVAHEFGTALHSFLAYPSGRVRLMENYPSRDLNKHRRQDVMDKLNSLDSPPSGVENAFALQKQFLTFSLTSTWSDRFRYSPPRSSERRAKRHCIS